MSFKARLFTASAVTLLTGACAAVDPGFGETTRYDMAAQIINPDPVYAENSAMPGANGEKAAEATKNYRKGQTKPIRRESVNRSGGSGGGGGSGSGSGSGPQ